MNGAQRIAAERERQRRPEGVRDGEGWSRSHDDGHRHGELALAAAAYAVPPERRDETMMRLLWPWERRGYKPDDRIRELEKAGALIAAEIDRLLWIV